MIDHWNHILPSLGEVSQVDRIHRIIKAGKVSLVQILWEATEGADAGKPGEKDLWGTYCCVQLPEKRL